MSSWARWFYHIPYPGDDVTPVFLDIWLTIFPFALPLCAMVPKPGGSVCCREDQSVPGHSLHWRSLFALYTVPISMLTTATSVRRLELGLISALWIWAFIDPQLQPPECWDQKCVPPCPSIILSAGQRMLLPHWPRAQPALQVCRTHRACSGGLSSGPKLVKVRRVRLCITSFWLSILMLKLLTTPSALARWPCALPSMQPTGPSGLEGGLRAG